MVEQVEELEADGKLAALPTGYLRGLRNREVRVGIAGPPEFVPQSVPTEPRRIPGIGVRWREQVRSKAWTAPDTDVGERRSPAATRNASSEELRVHRAPICQK